MSIMRNMIISDKSEYATYANTINELKSIGLSTIFIFTAKILPNMNKTEIANLLKKEKFIRVMFPINNVKINHRIYEKDNKLFYLVGYCKDYLKFIAIFGRNI